MAIDGARGKVTPVSSVWLSRIVFAAALLLPATVLDAALPRHDPTPRPAWLTGQFLVAATRMGDPRFRRTVILMVRHNAEGALGVTINRPIGERPLADLLEGLGEERPRARAISASSPAGRCSPSSASSCTRPTTGAARPPTSTTSWRSLEQGDPARHRSRSGSQQGAGGVRLRRLGPGPARRRAGARGLARRPRRCGAGLRRGPRARLGRGHRAPSARALRRGRWRFSQLPKHV